MKKSQLKHVIKPIVKQCLNELLIEQGLLSNIISEVVKGIQPMQQQTTHQPQALEEQQRFLHQQRMELEEQKQQIIKENKRKLLDATGFGVDVFKGSESIAESIDNDPERRQAGALSGVAPNDPGVNINGIKALANRNWGKMI